MEGVAEKARGAGGKVIPGREDRRVVGHHDGPFGVAARSGAFMWFHESYTVVA